MPKPEVPIDVNASTGVWETDGLPMLYVPRHFFINNHVLNLLGYEGKPNVRVYHYANNKANDYTNAYAQYCCFSNNKSRF